MHDVKKLYRSRTNRTVLGILGGLGDYFGMDATLLRVIFIVLLVLTVFVPLALCYVLACFVIPEEPS
ncbi:MAG: PspC domain-containing protein [Elusimicrobiota bacterium]|jgi:phage shock protein PspC (stress-responsive transcriptional regulator)